MLRDFQRAPFLEIVGERKVRNDAIMAAGCAIGIGALGRNKPIADIVGSVGAISIGVLIGKSLPNDLVRAGNEGFLFERGNGLAFWQVTKRQPAAFAARVFEIELLAAVLTLK